MPGQRASTIGDSKTVSGSCSVALCASGKASWLAATFDRAGGPDFLAFAFGVVGIGSSTLVALGAVFGGGPAGFALAFGEVLGSSRLVALVAAFGGGPADFALAFGEELGSSTLVALAAAFDGGPVCFALVFGGGGFATSDCSSSLAGAGCLAEGDLVLALFGSDSYPLRDQVAPCAPGGRWAGHQVHTVPPEPAEP